MRHDGVPCSWPRQSNGRGIIPQHIVAQTSCTYVLLLCFCLGVCPQATFARQRDRAAQDPPPAPLLPAEEAWNVSLPSPASAPGALDGLRVLHPAHSGQLVALNRETGANEWSIELTSTWPPLVSDGVVYAAGAGEVQAVDAAHGDRLWRVSLDAELMTAPALQGDSIVLLLKPDQLIALRRADGSEAWQRTIETPAASRRWPRMRPVSSCRAALA